MAAGGAWSPARGIVKIWNAADVPVVPIWGGHGVVQKSSWNGPVMASIAHL